MAAMQSEVPHTGEQNDEEQFGPQLVNKLEVSLHHLVYTDCTVQTVCYLSLLTIISAVNNSVVVCTDLLI